MTIQNMLNTINNNEELRNQLDMFSDVIFLNEPDFSFEDDPEAPQTEWSIERICAFAQDGSGGRFYLLSDNTIGFESSEGQADRIAGSTGDFLMLIVYCPYWMDFCGVRSLSYLEDRPGFFAQTEKERIDSLAQDGMDYHKTQTKLAQALGLATPASSFAVSEKFYAAVTREPRFYGICRENDSDETWETERLFEL